jgi:hypothetical protein
LQPWLGLLRDVVDVLLELLRHLVARLSNFGNGAARGLLGTTEDLQGGLFDGLSDLLDVLLELLQDRVAIGRLDLRRGTRDGGERLLPGVDQPVDVLTQLLANRVAQVVEQDRPRHGRLRHA